MTPDERNLLQRFLTDLTQTRGVVRDAAQDQIAALQNQMRNVTPMQPQSGSYFPSQQQSWMPAPAAQYVGAGPFANGGGLGSFIRNAGQMAVGVAAGDLLFDGISSLFGN